jgi:hypothetical protein
MVLEEKNLKKSANQKQESPVAAMFVMDRDRMSNLYRRTSIDASYQVSDHLGKRVRLQAWPPQATLVSDWLILKILLF